ncbi:hypothetical protein ABT404_02515 [Streptomyces hyaluromycini]|uniref:Uncharacterized protein n=1 Tax=Streptomyces hyaluromycini TaxID=1377993 RepID=A0ABV1WPE4_9ACTN
MAVRSTTPSSRAPENCHRRRGRSGRAGALGRQLTVLYEGANALAASSNDAEAFTDARRAAETLLDVALKTTP